ncbi:MAG: hypothetical protein AAF611_19635 [Bacteroidota bacterium]
MKKIVLLLVLSSFIHPSFGQTNHLENETTLLNCFYTNFKDNGAKLQNIIQTVETKLIAKGILKDRSGESYLNAFKDFENLQSVDIESFEVQGFITNAMKNQKIFDATGYRSCTGNNIKVGDLNESRMLKI